MSCLLELGAGFSEARTCVRLRVGWWRVPWWLQASTERIYLRLRDDAVAEISAQILMP